ncbi:MAG: hypothetical protein OXI25_01650, partial [Chloroflexota bacterium]|nr:hypothetical protein [Chloroflexota bacterium]
MTREEMLERLRTAWSSTRFFLAQFRNYIVTGLVIIIPLAATIFILRFIWDFLYNFLLPLFEVAQTSIPFIAGIYLQIIIVAIILTFLYALGRA